MPKKPITRESEIIRANRLAAEAIAPVVISVCSYGDDKDIQIMSIAIQDARTYDIIDVHILPASMFPKGQEDFDIFLEEIKNIWKAEECFFAQNISPINYCPECGEVIIGYYSPGGLIVSDKHNATVH